MNEEVSEKLEQALEDMTGYIDGGYEIAIHYGVPSNIAADHSKHMYSVILRLQRLLEQCEVL